MRERRRRAEAVALPTPDVVPLARPRARRTRGIASGRSLLAGFALLALAAGAYLVARETSAFAVQSIEVVGVPAPLGARVKEAVGPLVGTSLVSLDAGAAARRVLALPEIASVSLNRDFPHTLRITVRAETPVAVLRQADLAWTAAADGRILSRLSARPYPSLPRIWLPRTADVRVGGMVTGAPAQALLAVEPLVGTHLPLLVQSVRAGEGELTLVLRSGTEILLGDASDLRLKLAVASRIVPAAIGARYVDVTVPERAVAAYESQVAG